MSALTKSRICSSVAQSLREFGYPDVSGTMIRNCLNAWLTGKRDMELPHGVIGAFASRQFDEIDAERPGFLAKLGDD